MTKEPNNDVLDQEHDEVRAAFRAARFADEPPPAVDGAILAAAAKTQARRLHGYLPPLAMAATVVVALGLVLRLAIPTREMSEISDAPDARRAPSILEAEPQAEEARRGRSEAPAVPATAPALAPAADIAESAPATAAEPETAVEEAVVLSDTARDSAAQSMRAQPAECGEAFGNDPDQWLACIESLLDAGALAVARGELDAFAAAYPERSVPNTITDRLEP
jgi:hypothetical protein